MQHLLRSLKVFYEMIDSRACLVAFDPGFWGYLGLEMPQEHLKLTEVFYELVGREDEIEAILAGKETGLTLPGIRRGDKYFSLVIASDSRGVAPAFAVIEDTTEACESRQLLAQDRNEILLLKQSLEAQNERLSSLLGVIRDQNHTLETKVRQRTKELERSRYLVLTKLARVAEFRDQETGGHIYRIGRACALIGKVLGLAMEEREILYYASLLHDVGKIGIPDAILLKPGLFSIAEREVMKGHTTLGAQILEGEDHILFVASREVAMGHHERWDGSGYPEGRGGTEIPLMSRICAVADVFDALTSKRPYKDAWPVDRAQALVREESGKAFDPEIVRVFDEVLDDILRSRAGVEDLEALEPQF